MHCSRLLNLSKVSLRNKLLLECIFFYIWLVFPIIIVFNKLSLLCIFSAWSMTFHVNFLSTFLSVGVLCDYCIHMGMIFLWGSFHSWSCWRSHWLWFFSFIYSYNLKASFIYVVSLISYMFLKRVFMVLGYLVEILRFILEFHWLFKFKN